jgi:hypothetical protein
MIRFRPALPRPVGNCAELAERYPVWREGCHTVVSTAHYFCVTCGGIATAGGLGGQRRHDPMATAAGTRAEVQRFRERATGRERMGAVAAEPKYLSLASVGERVRCLLRCALFGSPRCGRCLIPDYRGAPSCPCCGHRLYYLGMEGGRAR